MQVDVVVARPGYTTVNFLTLPLIILPARATVKLPFSSLAAEAAAPFSLSISPK